MAAIIAFFDLLKGLAWPAAVVWVAYWFKPEIGTLLPRLRKAGPTGVEFDAAAREQQKAIAPPGKLKDIPGFSRTPAMERVERDLHNALEKTDIEAKTDLLIRILAQAQLELTFERIYRGIFGSQIEGLKRLNELGRVTVSQSREFFSGVERRFPEFYAQLDYESWLKFLLVFGLVRRDGDSLEITDLGRDFLFYVTAQRLPENKAF